MTFSQYLQMLFPHLGGRTREDDCLDTKPRKRKKTASQATQADFVVYIISAFIENDFDDCCRILNARPDTLRKTFSGASVLSCGNAQYILQHMDKQKFIETIDDGTMSIDAIESLSIVLTENGVNNDGSILDIATKCADLLEQIVKTTAGSTDRKTITESCAALEELISKMPRPTPVDPPPTPASHEQGYLFALYDAYGDALGIKPFGEKELHQHSEFEEDLQERRIDYFAAESIRRSIIELSGIDLTNQFDILEDEMYSGVRSKALLAYDNGFQKMLNVMDRAVSVNPNQYILSRSPYWINNRIKMGVCHFLVDDGKLWWVKCNG